MIRDVKLSDAESITNIYNHYIENTVITFEEEELLPVEIENRIKVVLQNYPWLVFEDEGIIKGYTYASKFKERSAYRFSTETTIYLHKDYTGRGIGYILYSELIKRLKTLNLKVAYGVIALPNPGSVNLHEKLGFKKTSHLTNVGFKFNRWIDVGYWELELN